VYGQGATPVAPALPAEGERPMTATSAIALDDIQACGGRRHWDSAGQLRIAAVETLVGPLPPRLRSSRRARTVAALRTPGDL
jgi:hypothetical protein